MKIEIHWPEGSSNFKWYGNTTNITDDTLPEDFDDFMQDVFKLSAVYDVIIDNGKITFVDKE